ncbi:DUF6268 family outer membrane beta-barrel protein [Winogradskyella aquimaris]|uniref:DUF6268 family outer membrane beta-barrel protein n=1 Tax=Winogradskyella aquimaris TaxID=864074 RepID=A0ABU5EPL4_9FLAO|nr:DUF6268 family outer membrane beta-barrel protein [Winogradskyella aquimaris]MDY2588400.1 DUF6268 family outer membrane beta-barrel protein [Winogradskyella aquimaris]
MSLHLLKCYAILALLAIGCVHTVSAQLTDLARLEYSFIPSTRSEDQYTRLRALINYPIQVDDKDYFIIGGEYNRIILNLEDNYPFNVGLLEQIHIIDLNLAYTFKSDSKWRFGFKINPRIASTLTKTLTFDDVFLNGGAYMVKDRTDSDIKRPYRLILGLTYNTTAGVPFPLPFISYYRRINEKWSFNAGVPKSNVKHFFNYKNMLQVFAGLDGYFAHVQEPTIVNGRSIDNISLSVAVGGIGYEYCFTKNLVAYSYIGYTFRLNNVLRNDARDEVFRLNNLNAFYLRTGIKFKI